MVKVLLAAANRYRDTLKVASGLRGKKKTLVRKEVEVVIDVSRLIQSCGNDSDIFASRFNEKISAHCKELAELEAFENDFYILRQAIILRNREVGVESLLLEMDAKKRRLDRIQGQLESIPRDNVYTISEILSEHNIIKVEDQYKDTIPVIVALIDNVEVKGNIISLTKEIEQLRKQLNYKNATTEVDIELSQSSKDKLGL